MMKRIGFVTDMGKPHEKSGRLARGSLGNTQKPDSKSGVRRTVVAAICVCALVGICVFLTRFLDHANGPAVSPRADITHGQLPQPRSLVELLKLPPDQLSHLDIGAMNILCAQGLPGAEAIEVGEYLARLDQWAQHVDSEIARNFHHFRENPTLYYNSEAFYKMLILAVVVYEDFGVRYNPKRITAPAETRPNDHFFADSRDIFIHGMIGDWRMGTCSSMPVLYIALGRRLGYPLKLVKTRQHLFLRWDGPTEKFDMDATGKGLDRYDDEHYRTWPFVITDKEIEEEAYLKSLSPREELSVFLSIRGACLTEIGRFAEATESLQSAYFFAPNWKGNRILLSQAQERQQRQASFNVQPRAANSQAANQDVPVGLNPFQQMENRRRKPCTL